MSQSSEGGGSGGGNKSSGSSSVSLPHQILLSMAGDKSSGSSSVSLPHQILLNMAHGGSDAEALLNNTGDNQQNPSTTSSSSSTSTPSSSVSSIITSISSAPLTVIGGGTGSSGSSGRGTRYYQMTGTGGATRLGNHVVLKTMPVSVVGTGTNSGHSTTGNVLTFTSTGGNFLTGQTYQTGQTFSIKTVPSTGGAGGSNAGGILPGNTIVAASSGGGGSQTFKLVTARPVTQVNSSQDSSAEDGSSSQEGGSSAAVKLDDGSNLAQCARCSATGPKETFFGKAKNYCSGNCAKGGSGNNKQQLQPTLVISTPGDSQGGTSGSSASTGTGQQSIIRIVHLNPSSGGGNGNGSSGGGNATGGLQQHQLRQLVSQGQTSAGGNGGKQIFQMTSGGKLAAVVTGTGNSSTSTVKTSNLAGGNVTFVRGNLREMKLPPGMVQALQAQQAQHQQQQNAQLQTLQQLQLANAQLALDPPTSASSSGPTSSAAFLKQVQIGTQQGQQKSLVTGGVKRSYSKLGVISVTSTTNTSSSTSSTLTTEGPSTTATPTAAKRVKRNSSNSSGGTPATTTAASKTTAVGKVKVQQAPTNTSATATAAAVAAMPNKPFIIIDTSTAASISTNLSITSSSSVASSSPSTLTSTSMSSNTTGQQMSVSQHQQMINALISTFNTSGGGASQTTTAVTSTGKPLTLATLQTTGGAGGSGGSGGGGLTSIILNPSGGQQQLKTSSVATSGTSSSTNSILINQLTKKGAELVAVSSGSTGTNSNQQPQTITGLIPISTTGDPSNVGTGQQLFIQMPGHAGAKPALMPINVGLQQLLKLQQNLAVQQQGQVQGQNPQQQQQNLQITTVAASVSGSGTPPTATLRTSSAQQQTQPGQQPPQHLNSPRLAQILAAQGSQHQQRVQQQQQQNQQQNLTQQQQKNLQRQLQRRTQQQQIQQMQQQNQQQQPAQQTQQQHTPPQHPTTLTLQQLTVQQQATAAASANLCPSPGSFLSIGPPPPSSSSTSASTSTSSATPAATLPAIPKVSSNSSGPVDAVPLSHYQQPTPSPSSQATPPPPQQNHPHLYHTSPQHPHQNPQLTPQQAHHLKLASILQHWLHSGSTTLSTQLYQLTRLQPPAMAVIHPVLRGQIVQLKQRLVAMKAQGVTVHLVPPHPSPRPSQPLLQQQQHRLPPEAPSQPPPPKPPTTVEKIADLDEKVKEALSGGGASAVSALKNLYTVTPPVWWLIFEKYPEKQERCAPLTAFPHFPMAQIWPDYIGGSVVFEIRLLPSELPANTTTNSTTTSGMNGIVHNYFTVTSNTGASPGSNSTTVAATATTNATATTTTSSTATHNGIGGTPTGRSSPLTTKGGGVNRKRNNNSTSENSSSSSSNNGGGSSDKDCFWFVRIVGTCGCYLRLRYIGLGGGNNSSSSNSSNSANSSNPNSTNPTNSSANSTISNPNSNANSPGQHDFWVNFRLRNLYPVGYASRNGHLMKAPKEVDAAYGGNVARITAAVMQTLFGGGAENGGGGARHQTVPTDLHALFNEALPGAPWLKTGLRVEAADKTKAALFRPATVDQMIGDRIHVCYDGEGVGFGTGNEFETVGLWTHLQGGQLRPVGWSQLVGAELLACEQYAAKSMDRAMNVLVGGHLRRGERRVEDWGALTREEKFSEKAVFKEGMKLEAVDPFNQLSLCVVTVRRVLRFGFLLLSIDQVGEESPLGGGAGGASKDPAIFCAHASSPYLLPAGFSKVHGINLRPVPGYYRGFSWPEYSIITESPMAPIDLFNSTWKSRDISNVNGDGKGFAEGQLLEAVDLLEPNLICIAVIKRIAGHLLLLHFIGWEDSLDQWADCRSPNIFPVGYCDLIGYPLQGPPAKDGQGPMTPTRTSSGSNVSFGSGGGRKVRKSRKAGGKSGTASLQVEDAQRTMVQTNVTNGDTISSASVTTSTSSTLNLMDVGGSEESEADSEASRASLAAQIRLQCRQATTLLEEYNFTEAMAAFCQSVEVSTPENSYTYNGADDLLEERGGSPTMRHYSDMLISEPKSGRKVWIGRKERLEEDDDYHSTVRPAIEIVEIAAGDEDFDVKEMGEGQVKKVEKKKFKAYLRYYNCSQSEITEEGLIEGAGEGCPWDGHRTSAMLRTQQSTICWYQDGLELQAPLKPSAGLSTLPASSSTGGELTVATVKAWNESQVAGWALAAGFPALYDPIVGMKITGERLWNLSLNRALKITGYSLSTARRFYFAVDRLRLPLHLRERRRMNFLQQKEKQQKLALQIQQLQQQRAQQQQQQQQQGSPAGDQTTTSIGKPSAAANRPWRMVNADGAGGSSGRGISLSSLPA